MGLEFGDARIKRSLFLIGVVAGLERRSSDSVRESAVVRRVISAARVSSSTAVVGPSSFAVWSRSIRDACSSFRERRASISALSATLLSKRESQRKVAIANGAGIERHAKLRQLFFPLHVELYRFFERTRLLGARRKQFPDFAVACR